MKYIKEFNQYEQIDEKIKFMDIVMYLSLLFAGNSTYNTFNDYKEINKLYTIVNSASYNGTSEQKQLVDSLKKNIIEQVRISPKFNKDIKSYILDSLQNITIKFANPTGEKLFKENSAAVYMNLVEVKKALSNHLAYYPILKINSTSKENIIIVNKKYENDEDLPNMLVHEIYHYVDALLGQKVELSRELNLSQFIDKNIDGQDKDYVIRKYSSIYGVKFSETNTRIKELLKELSNKTINHIEYLKLPEEIFARWKTFKSYMVKKGDIKDMNSPVDKDLFIEYVSSIKPSNMNTEDLEFLLVIDWDKIPELDKLSM